MRAILFLLLGIYAQPLLACSVRAVDVIPPRPTTDDEIELVLEGGCSDSCVPRRPRVTVASGTISIRYEAQLGGCTLSPLPWRDRVQVGRVPAGDYDLVVTHGGAEMVRRNVIVRHHPFTIAPSFGRPSTEVLLGLHVSSGPVPDVFFGDRPARSVRFGSYGDVIAVAPEHSAGLVDVTVRYADRSSKTAVDAFLYPSPDADLRGEYERVLFPSVYAGSGAHGSDWRSLNLLRNENELAVPTVPLIYWITAPVLVGPLPLPPGEQEWLRTEARDGGALVLVPRGLERRMSYASHVVDLSRRATDAGTEMHVVHESETSPELTILGVPVDRASRQTLRIYDIDAVEGREVLVFITPLGQRQRWLAVVTPKLRRVPCARQLCDGELPTFASISFNDLPSLETAGKVDVYVTAHYRDARLWAIASVTNNETQNVTTWSPQHRRRRSPRH